MSTANLPAYLQNAGPSRLTDTLGANLGGGSPPFLSIMGNRLTLVDNTGAQEPVTTVNPKTGLPYLDCCVIDVGEHASKIYYAKAFDPNAQSWAPPDCWSDNGIAPSINASLPQAKSCAPDPTGVNGCKLAVWGSKVSAVSGKGVPACSKYQKLAILIPGDDVLFLLRVPPNSLDNLRAYNAKFKGQPVGIDRVITRISFEPQGLGTLTFEAVTYVDEDTFRRSQAALAAKATDLLVGRGDQPRQLNGPAGGNGASPLPVQPAAAAAAPPSFALPAPPLATPTPQATPTTPSPATAATASPSEPAPQRRRRRTAAEMAAASAPQYTPTATATATATAPAGPLQAPFAVNPGPAPASFGIGGGVAPNAELGSALDSLFGPAT